jgi:hypothetical protein
MLLSWFKKLRFVCLAITHMPKIFIALPGKTKTFLCCKFKSRIETKKMELKLKDERLSWDQRNKTFCEICNLSIKLEYLLIQAFTT